MKKIFIKSAAALIAAFALTGCTVSEAPYDSSSTDDYSINIVDKSQLTEAETTEEATAPTVEETAAPVTEETAPVEVETEADIYLEDITLEADADFPIEDYEETYVDYYFRSEKQLEQHFQKHGYEFEDDFDYKTAEDYEIGASDVINNPDALYKTEADDGDGVYYIEDTNEFVVLSKDGYIRTYFRPSAGIDYFNRQ